MASYVRIIVAHKLPKKQSVLWYTTVHNILPSGMISQTQLTPDTYSKFYMKRLSDKRYTYIIPLVRDLNAHEVHEILQAWSKSYPVEDFILDYSQPVEHNIPVLADISQQNIAQAIESWSKQQHQKWMQDKMQQGWRFGIVLSIKNKTHPWLQPWESLPHAAKQNNLQACKDLVDCLKQFGYTIVQQPSG
jgi:hypothetical protein